MQWHWITLGVAIIVAGGFLRARFTYAGTLPSISFSIISILVGSFCVHEGLPSYLKPHTFFIVVIAIFFSVATNKVTKKIWHRARSTEQLLDRLIETCEKMLPGNHEKVGFDMPLTQAEIGAISLEINQKMHGRGLKYILFVTEGEITINCSRA